MARARTELIHCDNCGEDYAATYRRCPFCNAKAGQRTQEPYDEDAYVEDDRRAGGGRRLAAGSSQGGGRRSGSDLTRIVIYALAIVVVLALILFLLFKVIPGMMRSAPAPADTPAPVESLAPTPSEEPSAPPVEETDDPLSLDSPDLPAVNPDGTIASTAPSQAPASQAPASQSPASQTPAAAKPRLVANGRAVSEFSITASYPDPVRLRVRDGETSTWHSRNESIATVSGNGTVTGVGNGYTTIECTLTDGTKLTCTVHVSGKGGASSSPAPSSAPASQSPSANGARLTYAGVAVSEFSITAAHPDPIKLKVSGGTAASWRARNTNVATVTDSGTVRAVGNGNTTVECTLDNGAVLTCTVHVSGF